MYVNAGAEESTLYYIDEIITVSSSREKCQKSLDTIVQVVQAAGFEVQQRKTIGPARVIEYLGIEIDTCKKQLKISVDKLEHTKSIVQEWCDRKDCTKRELLSLIGTLNHVAQVVEYGSIFVRRLIHASKWAKNLYHRIYLCKDCRADLRWWRQNLDRQNGIKWFPRPFIVATARLLYSDASDTGAAAVLDNSWTAIVYEGEYAWLKDKPIMYRELHAVVLAVATFSHELHGSQVLMHIDNQAVHHCITSAKSKDYDINCLIRVLYYITSIHKIMYKSTHIYGVCNVQADALSRQNYELFRIMCPNANVSMCRPYRVPLDM